MRAASTAALALAVVLPIALARAFPGQNGNGAAREHVPDARRPVRPPITIDGVLFTAAPVYASLAALHGEERFPKGAQLMFLRAGKAQRLVPGFTASADANVSFDGKSVLFAGKKNAGDPWQIWEVPVAGGTARLVHGGSADAIRPLWLPDGRLVFAQRGPEGFALMSAAIDGGPALRLTYLPGNYIPDDVLEDGRVLFESLYPLSSGATPEMYLVYPDGSGVESVRCDHEAAEKSGGREHGQQVGLTSRVAGTGDIAFVQAGRLARFTSPLAGEAPVLSPPGEFAGVGAELPDVRWLLAMRRPERKSYELVAWRPGAKTMQTVVQDAEHDLIEPVAVAPRRVPMTFPSALHPWTTGNLLALDARLSRDGSLPGVPAMVRVETQDASGRAKPLGTAPVEEDGSFFLKVPGDAPLRLVLLDAAGTTLRQEHGWFWMRSGEQRICVGCHAGPERAPDNRVPAVLLRTTTPVDLSDTRGATAAGGH